MAYCNPSCFAALVTMDATSLPWARAGTAQRAGLREIPAIVQDVALPDRYAQMIENIQRDDLRAPEIARFIADRLDAGDTQAEISCKLGKAPVTLWCWSTARTTKKKFQHRRLQSRRSCRDELVRHFRCRGGRLSVGAGGATFPSEGWRVSAAAEGRTRSPQRRREAGGCRKVAAHSPGVSWRLRFFGCPRIGICDAYFAKGLRGAEFGAEGRGL
ncbi:hypothetical protein ABIA00_000032 [Bradyrhizobium ottawaense]